MEGACIQKKLTLAYPKHRFSPEDLLHFIESSEFSEDWRSLGLDDEEDLVSLQLCIMAHPQGDELIDGSGGLRKHHHTFGEWAINKRDVTAYYAYFQEYGIVYLVCVDDQADDLSFSRSEKAGISASILSVQQELNRIRIIR